MAARLHPLDHEGVDARADQLLRQRQRGAKQMSLAPLPLIRSIAPPGGSPPARTTWLTSCFAQTSISSESCGCMVMRLTPNGRSVRLRVSAISVSSRSGVIAPQAITPKAPALESAETRWRSEIQLIAPPITANSQPRKPAPRCIRRFRRSWPRAEEVEAEVDASFIGTPSPQEGPHRSRTSMGTRRLGSMLSLGGAENPHG